MKPPTRKLIGGVRESHTKEYLFQISAQTSGCRGRSKFHAQEQQEQRNQRKKSSFWGERERVEEEMPEGGACGPQEGVCGAARGWAAPPGLLGQGWTPLVSHRYFPMAFYLEIFILNFLGNFTVENFSKFKKLQKLS